MPSCARPWRCTFLSRQEADLRLFLGGNPGRSLSLSCKLPFDSIRLPVDHQLRLSTFQHHRRHHGFLWSMSLTSNTSLTFSTSCPPAPPQFLDRVNCSTTSRNLQELWEMREVVQWYPPTSFVHPRTLLYLQAHCTVASTRDGETAFDSERTESLPRLPCGREHRAMPIHMNIFMTIRATASGCFRTRTTVPRDLLAKSPHCSVGNATAN